MNNGVSSLKQIQIDKANVRMLVAISVTVFIVVFSAVAVRSLISRQMYQEKVIAARETARDQLAANIDAANMLTDSYETFIANTPNAIGGNPFGSGEKDGDNAKIILDALPSVYDFPALTASVEKLAVNQQLAIATITGIDDEVNQRNQSSSIPQPVEMPFTVTVEGDYKNINNLILEFEKSIRPFKIGKFVFTGSESGKVNLAIDAKSYYQPTKSLEIKKEVVK